MNNQNNLYTEENIKKFYTWNDDQITKLLTDESFAMDIDLFATSFLSNKENMQRLFIYNFNHLDCEKKLSKFISHLITDKESMKKFFTPDVIVEYERGISIKLLELGGRVQRNSEEKTVIGGLDGLYRYCQKNKEENDDETQRIEGIRITKAFTSDNPPSCSVKAKWYTIEGSTPPIEMTGTVQCHFSGDHKISKLCTETHGGVDVAILY